MKLALEAKETMLYKFGTAYKNLDDLISDGDGDADDLFNSAADPDLNATPDTVYGGD